MLAFTVAREAPCGTAFTIAPGFSRSGEKSALHMSCRPLSMRSRSGRKLESSWPDAYSPFPSLCFPCKEVTQEDQLRFVGVFPGWKFSGAVFVDGS
eukprot:3662013-Pyramimonas_sp.AAC.1